MAFELVSSMNMHHNFVTLCCGNINLILIYHSRKMSTGVGCDHPAWDIIIRKLDFQSQMKISQQNQLLANIVAMNAEHEKKY